MDANRWDYPYITGDAASGELVTADKLRNLAVYPRNSILSLLQETLHGGSDVSGIPNGGAPRSGVIKGMSPTSSLTPGSVAIASGLAMSYQAAEDAAGRLGYYPIVHPSLTEVHLADPDAANPRYDLIVARPNGALSEFAVRQIMLANGTKTTSSLPYRWDESYTFHVYTGIPAGVPTVPNGVIGDVPIAVVRLPAGAGPIVFILGTGGAATLYDVRSFLAPRVGHASQYLVSGYLGAATAAVTTSIVERITDPTIRIPTAWADFQTAGPGTETGQYSVELCWPKVFGTHSTSLFNQDVVGIATGRTPVIKGEMSEWIGTIGDNIIGGTWIVKSAVLDQIGGGTGSVDYEVYQDMFVQFETWWQDPADQLFKLTPYPLAGPIMFISASIQLQRTD